MAIHVTIILLCSDGAMKLSVWFLPPLGRLRRIELLCPISGVVLKPNEVTPLSSVAQTNSTNVPALTFLDRGITDSSIPDWVPAIKR